MDEATIDVVIPKIIEVIKENRLPPNKRQKA
jgi:hypothetical protein